MTVDRIDRRTFFAKSAVTLGGLTVAGGMLHALAQPAPAWKLHPEYGPLVPVAD